jgi:hypothetical protein
VEIIKPFSAISGFRHGSKHFHLNRVLNVDLDADLLQFGAFFTHLRCAHIEMNDFANSVKKEITLVVFNIDQIFFKG